MVIGVIPARLDSIRFPKKILANLGGKPLVAYVAEQATKAEKLDKVIIAIDAKETEQALLEYDFKLVMTSKNHASGTDRVAEVAKGEPEAKIIINIQGDEPFLNPKLIDGLVDIFHDPSVEMATVVSRKLTVTDLLNPNVVKAILDENQNTQYLIWRSALFTATLVCTVFKEIHFLSLLPRNHQIGNRKNLWNSYGPWIMAFPSRP